MIQGFARHLVLLCLLNTVTIFSFAQTSKIDSLLAVIKKLPADTNRVNTLNELCRAYSASDTEKMEQAAREALALAQKIHFGKGEAYADIYLALYYNKVGNAPRAIEFLLKALIFFEKTHDTAHTATCFNNIGIIYLSQDALEEALDYFNKAYAVWIKMNYKSGMVRALNNIASVYEKQKKDSLALGYYTPTLKLCEEIQDSAFTSQVLNSIGMIHLRQKAYGKAMTVQERALRLATAVKHALLQAQCYGAMSEIYANLGQPEKALTAANKALENALKVTSKTDLRDSYLRLYKAHEKLNNYREAYKFQSLYLVLSDSLKNSENVNSIEKLKSRYELDKKESEISLLTYRHRAETNRRDVFIWILGAMLVIGLLLYNRYHLITERKLALRKQRLDLYTRSLVEKSEAISRINREMQQANSSSEDIHVAKIDRILQSNILTEEDWENFKKAFEDIYPAFFSKLRVKYPAITVSELRMSAIIKLNLSIKETATMLGISPESVKTSRYRLKKKLGLSENETVEEFIEKLELPAWAAKRPGDLSEKVGLGATHHSQ